MATFVLANGWLAPRTVQGCLMGSDVMFPDCNIWTVASVVPVLGGWKVTGWKLTDTLSGGRRLVRSMMTVGAEDFIPVLSKFSLTRCVVTQ